MLRFSRLMNGFSKKIENHAGAIYVLTHVDITPNYLEDGLQLLKDMTFATAKDYGNLSFEVLQQADPANHFTVVEVWTNKKVLDAHAQAAHTREFRKTLLPSRVDSMTNGCTTKWIECLDLRALID